MPNSLLSPQKIVIASRESLLAMWQAKFIQKCLGELYPQTEISILGMTTRGDQILDQSLSKIGGKGLFIKELEQALEDGRADIAVHSMKDMPMNVPEGFKLAAITEREDPRDAFVSNQYASLQDATRRQHRWHIQSAARKPIACPVSSSQGTTFARQCANAIAQTR
jgi:hydroxymethylbilane synthase